jgi:hypothetical protein
MNLSQNAQAMVDFWIEPRNIPFKGKLIDSEGTCMCAQGQTLYRNGYTVEELKNMEQSEADRKTARILEISITHSILLRKINDGEEGAPQDVLTNPEKYLGPRYNEVLEFWLKIDELSEEQWKVVDERYNDFYNENFSEWFISANLAFEAAKKVVDEDYVDYAGCAAYDVTNSSAADWATMELIGGVENPTFLKMFDDL